MDKIGKPGNFEKVHFFPVSAPECYVKIKDEEKNVKRKETYKINDGINVRNSFFFLFFFLDVASFL